MANGKTGGPPGGIDQDSAKKVSEAMGNLKTSSEEVTREFSKQLRIMNEMQAAMQQIVNNMQALCAQDCSGFSPQKWNEMSTAIEKTEKATVGASEQISKLGKFMKSGWSKAVFIATGALSGLVQGFKNLAALSKGTLNLISSLIGGFFDIGRSIVAIPFKMLSGLFKMAGQAPGGTELQQAIENVRKEFGDLSRESSSTVIDVAKSMGKLDSSGVSAFQVFGNLAQRIEAVLKLAQAMGASFQVFQGEIAANGEAIMRYQKGLGLTDEMMSSIASNALRMGSGIADIQNDMTKQALGMSKAFGVNAKVISRDMGKAMQDLAHFGHLSTKEIAVAATFANKLGISVDKLTAVMDSTKTFDQAAEGMSKLNEQFGTNIDATEIMMAQNPAEKVEMLRKEFARTGKDMSKLTVQERDLIKQSSGMSDELLNAAFSAKNAGVSLDKMTRQGDNNEAKTLTQAEAMEKLASSIERMVMSGSEASGLFDALKKGFLSGIQTTPEFIGLMQNLKIIIRDTTMAGVRLGKMFAASFPGFKDVIQGLKDMFDPKRFRTFFKDIENIFKSFKDGQITSFTELMDKLKDRFFNFFKEGAPEGKKILEGFKKFGLAAVGIIGKLGEWIIPKLADGINELVGWLKNPQLPGVSGAADGFASALLKPLLGSIKAFKEKLIPALESLGHFLWEKFKEVIAGPVGVNMLKGALAIVIAPAITGAMISMATSGIFKSAGKSLVGSLASSTEAAAGSVGVTKGAAAAISAAGTEKAAKAGSGGLGDIMQSSIPDAKTINSMQTASKSKVDWENLGAFLAGLAGVFAIGIVALWAAIKLVGNVPIEKISKAVLALVGIGMAMDAAVPALLSAKLIGSMVKESAKEVALGMAALAATVVAIAGTAILITEMVGDIPIGKLASAGAALIATASVFAIAGGVLIESAAVGAIILASQGAGAAAMALGMIAMTGAVAFIAYAARKIVENVGNIDVGKALASAAVLTAVLALFVSAGGVIMESALIGTYVIGSLGTGAAAMAIGMLAISKAILHIANTANNIVSTLSKSIENPAAFALAGLVMAGMIKLFDATLEIVKEAGLVGSYILGSFGVGAVAIAIGMKTISMSINYIASVASSVITAVGGIEVSNAAMAATIMTAMSAFFVAAGAIIVEAGLIGAGIVASFGAGGTAILIGMKTMKSVTMSIADTAIEIIQKISTIPGNPAEIKTKAEAFSAVVAAISGLTNSVAGNMKGVADASAFDPNAGTNLDKIKNIMNDMMQGPDGNGGIRGLINTILNSLKDTSPQQVESGKAVGTILQSAATLIRTLSEPTKEIREETSHWWQTSAADNEAATAAMTSLSTFVGSMGTSIGTLVKTIGEALKQVGSEGAEALKTGGTAIADILGAVTQLTSAIMQPMKNPPKVDTGSIKATNVIITNNIPDITGIITGMSIAIPGLVRSINDVVRSMPTDKEFVNKLDIMKNLFSVIAMIPTLAKGLAEVSQGTKSGEAAKFDEWAVTNTIAAIGTFFQRIFLWQWQGGDPPMTQIINALKAPSIQELGTIKGNISAVKSVFEMIGSIPKAIAEFSKGDTKFDHNQGWSLSVQVMDIADFLYTITQGNKLLGPVSPLWRIKEALAAESVTEISKVKDRITGLKDVFGGIAGIVKSTVELDKIAGFDEWNTAVSVGKVATFLSRLSNPGWKWGSYNKPIFGAIKDELDNAGKLVPGIEESAKALKVGGLKTAIEAVTEVTKAVQELDDALQLKKGIDIKTRLESIAKGAGLGSKGQYTVDSKAVQLTINFEIYMDADKVEKTLITRSKSIIRDRINYMIENWGPSLKQKDEASLKQDGEQYPGKLAVKQP